MNANELADKLNQFGEGAVFASIKLTDVATMLRQQQAEIEALKNPIMQAIALAFDPVKELTEILATIKCLSDEVSPYKEYENTYSDGWLDACNTVYDEVFAILRKAQEK